MITLNTDQQRLPIGGHHFHEAGMVVRAEKFDDLVRKVRDLRITNGHPVGDPKTEIIRYYAEAFPYMVHYGKEGFSVPKFAENYVRYRLWVQTTWAIPPKKLVTTKEASYRWDVCKTCPFNLPKNWERTRESEEVDRRAYLLRSAIDIPEGLGFCSLHRADIGVLSFIEKPLEFSAKSKDKEDYEKCWVSSSLAGR